MNGQGASDRRYELKPIQRQGTEPKKIPEISLEWEVCFSKIHFICFIFVETIVSPILQKIAT